MDDAVQTARVTTASMGGATSYPELQLNTVARRRALKLLEALVAADPQSGAAVVIGRQLSLWSDQDAS